VVENPGGHHLAGEAAACEIGWNRKRLDQETLAAARIPDHEGETRRNGEAYYGCRQAQQHAEASFPDAEIKLFELYVQVMTLIGDKCWCGRPPYGIDVPE
jgi:hypothetical protein